MEETKDVYGKHKLPFSFLLTKSTKHKKGIDKHSKVCYNIITKKNKTQVSRKEKQND